MLVEGLTWLISAPTIGKDHRGAAGRLVETLQETHSMYPQTAKKTLVPFATGRTLLPVVLTFPKRAAKLKRQRPPSQRQSRSLCAASIQLLT